MEAVRSREKAALNYDSSLVNPLRKDPRYSLSYVSLGRLERLAKARFILSEKVPGFDPSIPDKTDPEIAHSIIATVFASSEIEGEGISAEYLPVFVAANTEPGEHVNVELQTRLAAHQDIIAAHWWALDQDNSPVLPYDFVLELHRRMFSRTKPDLSGKIKQ